ncbi:lipid IV(A) 3-deoxy-D-manno-octulosonic acid transferase [Photobacterium sp. 2_MG-2023]|uniref:lipid IV(A) 3-deoxy-D-manno-octulosonic acid transferase n=1 Tax=Photobacterium sp. 2_MG-2023 TaxID=3062663 RepID=UPI0026E2D7C1|nr:lipid IV(A) 3-deoxy-D-manno-octulosonic acid transferase [Photobacterium sp. 2_MG-2023]MDO6580726.1 lipid IV(A) 3-deoxy-D-manno-octulosonic acid transferase [Photobacterium sp. 2_MG-2023]
MMLRFLYTCLLAVAAPILLVSLYKKRPGVPPIGQRWKEHFGVSPQVQGQRPLWIHAVSVGETLAVTPLIKALKAQYPDLPILLTTTTATGAEQAARLGSLVEHRYMPLDFPWALRRFIRIQQPRALCIMETELWPNTLAETKHAGLPVTVFNARLSERSCQRYARVQPLFNLLACNLDQVLCQHQDDAERFIRLGVSPEAVQITGSIKFDLALPEGLEQASEILRDELGSQRPVWIAASTHQGEDEQVLEAHRQILRRHPDALLILVPRHPERFDPVYALIDQQGFTAARRTQSNEPLAGKQVYLADTMGEMMLLLGACDLAFVGGSLLGNKVGGHNLLEPAALAKPVLSGPSYYNFTDITTQLLNAGGAEIVGNSEELARAVSRLMADKAEQAKTGQAALDVVKTNQGAIARTLHALSASFN